MAKKKVDQNSRTLQSLVDNLVPYLRSIVIDEVNNYRPILYLVGYLSWELPTDSNFLVTQEPIDEFVGEYEITILNPLLGLDELVEFTYTNIVLYNHILEEKREEIERNIERINAQKEAEIEAMKKSILSSKQQPTSKVVEKHRSIPSVPPEDREQLNLGVNDDKISISLKDFRAGNFDPVVNQESQLKSKLMADNADLFARDEE